MKFIKKLSVLFVSVIFLNIALLIQPEFLFANKYEYRNFSIHSDREIPNEIESVLDDAILRLEASSLYDEKISIDVFLCNDNWRFTLLTRAPEAGGLVNFVFSPNIYIRENDIKNNAIIPPESWSNPLDDRPLSYFIAHEAIHSLQRNYDPFLVLKASPEVIEGYADYIAKGSSNNLESLLKDYDENKRTMNLESGLYDKYQLYVRYLIEEKGYTFTQLVKEQPDLETTLSGIELN